MNKDDAATCFLKYGTLASSGKEADTVFECACKAAFNGTGSNGIKCAGKCSYLICGVILIKAQHQVQLYTSVCIVEQMKEKC